MNEAAKKHLIERLRQEGAFHNNAGTITMDPEVLFRVFAEMLTVTVETTSNPAMISAVQFVADDCRNYIDMHSRTMSATVEAALFRLFNHELATLQFNVTRPGVEAFLKMWDTAWNNGRGGPAHPKYFDECISRLRTATKENKDS